MASPTITTASVFEDSAVRLLARLMVEDGGDEAAAVQADISSIGYKVYRGCDLVSNGTGSGTGSFIVADTIFDELQTGSQWAVDATGFNFKATLPAVCLPDGNATYHVEVRFTLVTNSEIVPALWEITTVDLMGS